MSSQLKTRLTDIKTQERIHRKTVGLWYKTEAAFTVGYIFF